MVGIHTKLNRSHLLHEGDALILPCLGRSDRDLQAGGPQAVTVEDSMSMVHASRGFRGAGLAGAALRARDRRRAGARHAARQPRALGGARRRLRPHPRADRAGRAGLRELQRADPPARRLSPAQSRGGARVAHARRPRPVHSLRRRTGRRRRHATRCGSRPCAPTTSTTPPCTAWTTATAACSADATCVFMNEHDLAALGLARATPCTSSPRDRRRGTPARTLAAIAYAIARGSCAAYYPEAMPLIALADHDPASFTPAYKSVWVRVEGAT